MLTPERQFSASGIVAGPKYLWRLSGAPLVRLDETRRDLGAGHIAYVFQLLV